jgi:hypothetical protein
MLFFWQIGLVDTFSLIQFCVNTSSQYVAIVVGSAGGSFSDIGLKALFESAVRLDPTANGAVGAAVVSKIAYMRAVLTRGGGSCKITK